MFKEYTPQLGLLGTGLSLWLIGLLIIALLPVLTAIGVVFVTLGKLLFWIGVIVLVASVVIGLVKSLFS